jgi:hypothetical protein
MTGWRVHAWVLMTNHYHLLIQIPRAQPRGRHEMASKHLHPALQYSPPALGPSLRRPV